MPKVSLNNQGIYYELHGNETPIPLVLIAGLGQYHTLWDPILDNLASFTQVLVFDNRGSGQSDVPSYDYTTQDMAQDLNALLDNLNIKKANILGASMGGLIAQQFALNFPAKLNDLILYSSFAKIGIRAQRLLLNTAKFFENGYIEDALNCILTNAYSDQFLSNHELVKQAIAMMKNDPYPQSSEAFYGQLNASCQHDTTAQLPQIKHRTLIIAGKRDILSMQDEAELLHNSIPNATLVTIPEVAHLAHIENSAAFLSAVKEFLVLNHR